MHPECDMFDLGRPTWTSGIEGNKMADSMARQEHWMISQMSPSI